METVVRTRMEEKMDLECVLILEDEGVVVYDDIEEHFDECVQHNTHPDNEQLIREAMRQERWWTM